MILKGPCVWVGLYISPLLEQSDEWEYDSKELKPEWKILCQSFYITTHSLPIFSFSNMFCSFAIGQKTLAICNGTKTFAIGQKHLQFAIGQKHLQLDKNTCNL